MHHWRTCPDAIATILCRVIISGSQAGNGNKPIPGKRLTGMTSSHGNGNVCHALYPKRKTVIERWPAIAKRLRRKANQVEYLFQKRNNRTGNNVANPQKTWTEENSKEPKRFNMTCQSRNNWLLACGQSHPMDIGSGPISLTSACFILSVSMR